MFGDKFEKGGMECFQALNKVEIFKFRAEDLIKPKIDAELWFHRSFYKIDE